MGNRLLTLRFRGTRYHGFQVQKNALSVCEAFQDGVEKVLGSRPDVKGCSRTDTGVHALMYCLSMRVEKEIPCERLILALNQHLPEDIAVTGCREVDEGFHARYHCEGKEYVYKIHNSRVKDPFLQGLAYRYGPHLDVEMLHAQAQDYVGRHDFAAFQSKGSDIQDTIRTIHSCSVRREGEAVLFTVRGNGFLYNMVRIMAGTLIYIAMGRIPMGTIPDILDSTDRQRAGKTMPAYGLYLSRVFYSGDDLKGLETGR